MSPLPTYNQPVTSDEWPQPPRDEPHGSIDPSVLDNLRQGATVGTTDGKHVGTLHAVVIDARDDDITHLAVNAGRIFRRPASARRASSACRL